MLKTEPETPLTFEPSARGAELEDPRLQFVLLLHLQGKPYATPGSETSFLEAAMPTQYNHASSVWDERTEEHFYDFCSGSKSQWFYGIWLSDCASPSGAKWLFKCFEVFCYHCLNIVLRCLLSGRGSESRPAVLCPLACASTRRMKRPVFYCVDRWLLLPGVPHLCIHQGFVPSSDPGWPFFPHHFSLPFNMNGLTLSAQTPGCVDFIPLKHIVKPNLKRRLHKWQGNNRKPTTKCLANLERADHDVETEWNKSVSTVKLCRPCRRVKNNGKELSAEVHETDR